MPGKYSMICTLLLIFLSLGSAISVISLYEKAVNFLKNYQNFPQMRPKCRNQIKALSKFDPVALEKMFDASTKLPTGFLDGVYKDFGSYDECYNIKVDVGVENDGPIYGKYCTTVIADGADNQKVVPPYLKGGFADYKKDLYGVTCLPHECSLYDFSSNTSSLKEFSCYSQAEPMELDIGAWSTISVLIFFAVLVVLSTIYDTFLHYTKTSSRNELFVAFSALRNGRHIFTSTTNQDQLLCLNGIKAISMMWVILGHGFKDAVAASFPDYVTFNDEFVKNPINMVITNSPLAVDTFLSVTGLLIVYTYMRSIHDKRMKFNIFKYYIHRIVRLTPVMAICILMIAFLVRFWGDGPHWKYFEMEVTDPCQTKWWYTLLYIQNFSPEKLCISPSWYLAVDMQLYILSPIILIPLVIAPLYTLLALGFLIIAGTISPFLIAFIYKLFPFQNDFIHHRNKLNDDFNNEYYSQPYTRFEPYVCGMLVGYFVYKIKKGTRIVDLTKVRIFASWMVTLTILVSSVFAPHILLHVDYDRWIFSAFFGYSHLIWSIGLGMLVVLCVSGYGGPIDTFLSLPIFQILTKLSYSTYLVHNCLIHMRISQMRTIVYSQSIEMYRNFWGDFAYSTFAALILCLMFEYPMVALEKLIFRQTN